MNTLSDSEKNVGAFIHLSTFLKYFLPLANFIAPLIIWSVNKEKESIDAHGRAAINFQLSLLLYKVVLALVCLPFLIAFAIDFFAHLETFAQNADHFALNNLYDLSGHLILFFVAALLFFCLFVFELFAVISATIHASKGEFYQYPLCIPFIKINLQKEQS